MVDTKFDFPAKVAPADVATKQLQTINFYIVDFHSWTLTNYEA